MYTIACIECKGKGASELHRIGAATVYGEQVDIFEGVECGCCDGSGFIEVVKVRTEKVSCEVCAGTGVNQTPTKPGCLDAKCHDCGGTGEICRILEMDVSRAQLEAVLEGML